MTSMRRLTSPFSRSIGFVECSLVPMRGWKAHECQHTRLGLVHQPGDLGSPLVGDFAPLQPGCSRSSCAKGGDDEGGDHTPPLLPCVGERIAHEVDAGCAAN